MNKQWFPTYWKIRQVTPIFKESSKADVTCYRPISILCCSSKVFEKLIFDKIYYFFERKLHPSQYGFRKQPSATLQLITFLDQIFEYNDLEETRELSVLYLDFAKAFDTVSHVALLEKLKFLGIGGSIWGLINSYLSNRKRFVQINGQKSFLQNFTSGVPQGSILGPLLFLVFINDYPEMMEEVESYGYADDFKAIARNQNDMNKATEAIQKWLETNKMKLNTKKSHILNIKGSIKAKIGETDLESVST